MQIRLDSDIARLIKRNAAAHRRMFKRRKSYAAVVNEALRDLFGESCGGKSNIVTGAESVVDSAARVYGWKGGT